MNAPWWVYAIGLTLAVLIVAGLLILRSSTEDPDPRYGNLDRNDSHPGRANPKDEQ